MGTFQAAIDYAPYLITKQKGRLENARRSIGFSAEYSPVFQSLPTVNQALAAKHIDLAMTAEIPALIGKAAGIDIKIAWLSCTLNSQVIGPASSKATSIKDLKGKKITVLAGTSPQDWFIRNLET